MKRSEKGNDEKLKMVRNKKENEKNKRRWKKMVEEKEWKGEMVRRKDERKVKIKKGWRMDMRRNREGLKLERKVEE